MAKGRISIYWWCQILGWGSAALYWSYYTFRHDIPAYMAFYSVSASFFMGILTTHAYKLLSHRYQWHLLPIRRLLPVMFLGILSLLLIYTISGNIVGYSIHGKGIFNREAFMGMVSGGLRYNAIWVLAFHLYHYAKRESKMEMEKAQIENLAMKMQIDQLNKELNPHFLFNALNSIKALVNENPDGARKALVLLSNILRYSLGTAQKDWVSVEEELEQVVSYLQLEKIRFEERLMYTIKVGEASKRNLIPPLSLLNLVENAIKHGINQTPSGGEIRINVQVENKELLMKVKNSGQAIDGASLGLGLNNLKDRLHLLYGNKAVFSLKNINTNEVCASLQIPVSDG